MESLFYLGIIFVFGALTEWLSPKFHMPKVVGYLILGLIIGPEVLGIIPHEFVDNTHIITELSLSIIAVLVGATVKFSSLNGRAKEILYITFFQSFSAFIIVTFGFILMADILNFSSEEAVLIGLLLGGIATATAPASPLAIVQELHAKGKFTSTFLAVIAADDAIALVIFTLALTAATTILEGGAFAWLNITDSLKIIIFSSAIGVVAALIGKVFQKLLTHHKGMQTIATLGLIFIVYSLSEYWHLEPLLSAMIMGVVLSNSSTDFNIVEKEIDNHLTEIIFMLFFIISAMHLNFNAVFALPIAIELYVVSRMVGKIVGSYLGAVLARSSSVVKKYIGIALMPQAGVAIGLALSLQQHEGLESIAPIILNVVIATTFLHELIGPFFTKYALLKSGECK